MPIDDEARDNPDVRTDMSWTRPVQAERLRQLAAGGLSTYEAAALIGWAVDDFAAREGAAIEVGSAKWHQVARMLTYHEVCGLSGDGLLMRHGPAPYVRRPGEPTPAERYVVDRAASCDRFSPGCGVAKTPTPRGNAD